MADEEPIPLKVGTFAIRGPAADDTFRMAMLLWGNIGSGKTTLAATAPGKKLLILADSEGDKSLTNRSDVQVLDTTGISPTILGTAMMSDDPFGIDGFLKAHPEYETVIADSLTAFNDASMPYVIRQSSGEKMSLLAPGIAGYARRNVVMKKFVSTLLTVTRRHNRHVVFTCHEGSPETDKQGNLVQYPTTLSTNLAQGIGLQLNECWYMSDSAGKRNIYVRPFQLRKLVKSRMFAINGTQTGFVWNYNPLANEGDTIERWFLAYKKAGGHKIPLPSR